MPMSSAELKDLRSKAMLQEENNIEGVVATSSGKLGLGFHLEINR